MKYRAVHTLYPIRDILLITVDSLRADNVVRTLWPLYMAVHSSDREVLIPVHELFLSFGRDSGILSRDPVLNIPSIYRGFEQISEDRTLITKVLNDVEYNTGGFK